ncbi:MAG: MAPEG family protein, partial [Hyphomicrobiaceae bacterium]
LPARFFSMKGDGLKLDDRDVKLGLNVWSDQAQRTHNSYKSQFELPVLFYAVSAFSMLAGTADQTMVALAWVFVGLRIAHAIIHNGPNNVMIRGPVFGLGVLVVSIMWVRLFLHVL